MKQITKLTKDSNIKKNTQAKSEKLNTYHPGNGAKNLLT